MPIAPLDANGAEHGETSATESHTSALEEKVIVMKGSFSQRLNQFVSTLRERVQVVLGTMAEKVISIALRDHR